MMIVATSNEQKGPQGDNTHSRGEWARIGPMQGTGDGTPKPNRAGGSGDRRRLDTVSAETVSVTEKACPQVMHRKIDEGAGPCRKRWLRGKHHAHGDRWKLVFPQYGVASLRRWP